MTNGTISLVEQGQVSPSVGSLKKLVDALGLSLGEFFTMDLDVVDQEPFFVPTDMAEIGSANVSLKMVPAGLGNAKLEVLHERYAPGADTGPELLSHPGEEAGVVVRGEITIKVGPRERVLRAGDSYYFDSRIPHRFRNRGTELCEIVSASTPRTF